MSAWGECTVASHFQLISFCGYLFCCDSQLFINHYCMLTMSKLPFVVLQNSKPCAETARALLPFLGGGISMSVGIKLKSFRVCIREQGIAKLVVEVEDTIVPLYTAVNHSLK